MTRPSPSVLLQVAAVILVSVLAAQAIVLALLLLAPPPEARRMTIAEAVNAVRAERGDLAEKGFTRRTLDAPPVQSGGSESTIIALSIAQILGTTPSEVRVFTLEGKTFPRRPPGVRVIPATRIVAAKPGNRRVDKQAELSSLMRNFPVPFPAFATAVRQDDGRWVEVRPVEPFLSGWRGRVLLALGFSLLLAIPLAWWSARALTRPIRFFAKAAEEIGRNPDAEPLPITGPAEIRQAAASMNWMQDRLQRYIKERTTMVAAIAHDLRTPLTGLRLSAEAAPDPVRERLVPDIKRMEAMIAQALAFVRGEMMREPREPVDLTQLAASCVAEASDRGGAVLLNRADPLPVTGEPINLSRAINNLIENALYYAGTAELVVRREGDQAALYVRDRGPGLSEGELERVFGAFQRGETSRNRDTGGVGLGLTSARTIARAHGGDIVLRNLPGGGLEARLLIPLG